MGDRSNFNLWVPKVPDGIPVDHLISMFEVYAGDRGSFYVEDTENGGLLLGANDVSVGSVDSLNADLQQLIAEGFDDGETQLPPTDFAYRVNDEPAYEYLGSIVLHVPGMEDLAAECDADANVVLNNNHLLKLVEDASDLTSLRTEIRRITGENHYDAMRRPR